MSRQMDPGRAREHMGWLRREYGLSVHSVAALSGLAEGVLAGILYPHSANGRRWIEPQTEAAVLATTLDLDRLPDTNMVAAAGTSRRLDALQAMGWPLYGLARPGLVSLDALCRVRRQDAVTVGVAWHVRDVYRRCADVPGPSARVRARARGRGYLLPAAWDDDEMDMVSALPHHADPEPPGLLDEVVVVRLMAGDRHPEATRDEKREAARRLLAAGMSQGGAAAQVGVSERTITRWVAEATNERTVA